MEILRYTFYLQDSKIDKNRHILNQHPLLCCKLTLYCFFLQIVNFGYRRD